MSDDAPSNDPAGEEPADPPGEPSPVEPQPGPQPVPAGPAAAGAGALAAGGAAGAYANPYDPGPLHRPADAASPFLWKLILCFLVLDGFERLVELVLFAVAVRSGPGADISPYAPNVYVSALWILVNFLLATLLGLRARAGRVWTFGIFAIHLFYLGHVMAVRHPYLWVYLGEAGRFRILVTAAIDVAALGWLLSAQSRRTLYR